MDLLEMMKAMLNESTDFIQSKNYYFDMHQCPSKGENVKVQMNYKLSVKNEEKMVLFGACPHCKIIVYHESYEERNKF